MADAGNRKLPLNVYVMLLVSSVLLAFGMGFCSFIWNLSFHGTGPFTSGWRNNGRFQGIIPAMPTCRCCPG